MTRDETEDSVDLWRQVASAVEYIAAVERPGFTVWSALGEALSVWLAREPVNELPVQRSAIEPDELRRAASHLLERTPPVGACGGWSLADVFAAALASWVRERELETNGGHPFHQCRS